MHIVLYHPEIPPNTGNIARLCAATNTPLHLIEPLGFSLDDRYLKRAGLDYWPSVTLALWPSLEAYLADPGEGRRLIATSARRGKPVHTFRFRPDDALLFGPETTGLPSGALDLAADRVRIPTLDTVRSLNLSTAAGIILYQGLIRTGGLTGW